MSGYRADRLSEDFKRELSVIIRELKDPRISPLTSIVRCEVTNDLSVAKINISCIGGIEDAKSSVKGLTSASGYIKREISHRLKMRKMPELRFIADDSIAHSAEINLILESVLPKEDKSDGE